MNKQYPDRLLLMLCILISLTWSIYAESCIPFDQYVAQQNLSNSPDFNYNTSLHNYQSNCHLLEQIHSYTAAPDKYMHLSPEDISRTYGLFPIKLSETADQRVQITEIDSGDIRLSTVVLPASYSLYDLGWVSPVQNQQNCGSCLAFTSVAMYESYLLKRGFTYGLSEEAALQCVTYYATNNRVNDCIGGYFDDYLNYHQSVGNVLRTNYPYISGTWGAIAGYRNTSGICAQTNRIILGTGTKQIYTNLSSTQIKTLLYTEGSLMAAISVNRNFQLYTSGIFDGCSSNGSLNHAVLLIGYNQTEGSWLIKNSWGTIWGQSGFMRLNMSNNCGMTQLLGNIKYTSYNTDPVVNFNDSSLLFGSSSLRKFNYHFTLNICLLIILSFLI